MTVAELTTARDTLQRALYSGQFSVRFSDGRMVVYQDSSAMLAALRSLDSEIITASVTPASAEKTTYVEFSRE